MSVEAEIPTPTLTKQEETDIISTFVGEVEEWERNILSASDAELGKRCVDVAEHQTSIQRAMKWLRVGVETNHAVSIISHAALTYGVNPNLEYKEDEASVMVSRLEPQDMTSKLGSFYGNTSRFRRCLSRTLLLGSLYQNQQTPLYRCFFRSSIRETQLLPLIINYLPEESKLGATGNETDFQSELFVYSLFDLSRFIFNQTHIVKNISLFIRSDNHFISFLPVLLSRLPDLKWLEIRGEGQPPKLDLSCFSNNIDTSRLESLVIRNCSIDTLSPLSLCDFSSLLSLRFGNSGTLVRSLSSLTGLSIERMPKLQELDFYTPTLIDISSLSHMDLSSLKILNFYYCSLSDLSPLRGLDLSSLEKLHVVSTNVADLSPLVECKGFIPQSLVFSHSLIEDISPLSLLNLSNIRYRIDLRGTRILDISPLENISATGICVDITDTPAAKELEGKRLTQMQLVGKVHVIVRDLFD